MPSREHAPVFVVGSARSGNTLLYHMLVSSGHFPVYRTEPAVFDLLAPRFGDLSNLATRRRLMECWLRSRQFRRSGLDASKITEKVVRSVRNHGDFLRAVMEEMAQAGGFARWAVWGPDNLLHIPTIKQQIPDALFIHVIRDGRDVAVALNKKQFIRPLPWDGEHRLLVSGLHWMWKVRQGRRYGRGAGEDYMEIRFEDLVLQPRAALARIGAFIGQELDYQRIREAQIGTVRVPNTSFGEELQSGEFSPVGRWKKQLREDEVALLEELIGGLLVELGYPLSRPQTRELSFRMGTMRVLYPAFYDLKEWLKMCTPLGRFVNVNRLYLDKNEDPKEVSAGLRTGGCPATAAPKGAVES